MDLVRFLIFLGVGLLIVGLIHFALWIWLLRDPQVPEPWRRIGRIALVTVAALGPLGMTALFLVRRPEAQLFSVGVFTWLALAMQLSSALLLMHVALGLGLRVGRAKPDPKRRVFLARAVAGTASVAAGTAGALGLRSALGPAELHEVPVKLARLPAQLSGFTIAQVSDLHVGPTIREREVQRVVEQVNGLTPDLVVITGDLVDGSVKNLGFATGHLAGLKSRFGTYFVTGNHEYYSGADEWAAELRRLGITVLRGQRVSIGDSASFDLAGFDDWAGGGGAEGAAKGLAASLEGRDPERALVLLQHQPKGVDEAVKAGVGLQLSGHTHGGQLIPFNLVVGAVYPYLAGLYANGGGHVFVSRGTGYWGPPLRFGEPPEIAKLVLTA